MHVSGKQSQVGIIASVERQLDNLLRIDDLAMLAGVGFQHGSRTGHLDRFGNRTNLHGYVHTLPGIHVYTHIWRSELRKTGMFHVDRVPAELDVEEIVISVAASCGRGLDAG